MSHGARAQRARLSTPTFEIIQSMRHPRVRRPFIVESRGTGRDGGSIAIPKRIQPAAAEAAKPGARATMPLFDPWAAVTAPPEPVAAPRRILPNLLVPEEPAPIEIAVETAPPEDARLPRVRRVKPRAESPVTAKVQKPVMARIALPAPVLEVAVTAPAKTDRTESPATPMTRPVSRVERKDRASLPAGQRWKARLPRACW